MVETPKTSPSSTEHLTIEPAPTIPEDHFNPSVRLLQIPKTSTGSCGFHLSRSKWDPYPWVSAVDDNTPAEVTGLKAGDCVLEVNGEDILGLRISEVADLVRGKSENVTLLLWSTAKEVTCDPESICCGPMPLNLERLSATMQTILSALECPVCLETIPPPVVQCLNGHLFCIRCRARSEKCPICRERYSTGRLLLAEQIYNSVTEAFNLRDYSDRKLRDKLFGVRCKRNLQKTTFEPQKPVQSPTNKFLAKILGKATSLDNLTCKKDTHQLEVESIAGTKQLSLSTNDISKKEAIIAIPRCPSGNRLNPTGSLTLNGLTLLKRPSVQSSLNTSTECIAGHTDSEKSLTIPVPIQIDERVFFCPCSCGKKFNGTSLQHHVRAHHNIPIVFFGSSSAEIALPPKAPIEDAIMILALDYKQFWLKLRIDDDGSIFTSVLLQGFEDESFQYMMEVRLRNRVEDRLLERELITRSIVYSLTNTSWDEVLQRQFGIFYNQETIRTTFPEGSDLLLRIDVKNRDD